MSMMGRLPYPGLRAYHIDESDLFFGREDCVEEMIGRLAATRFLAVLGASGSGKSSLVRTGLIDGLELGLMGRAGSRWLVADCHPGGQPIRNLAAALNDVMAAQGRPGLELDLLESYLRRGPRSVIGWCQEGNLPPRTNLLLLVDQFEELFRYGDYDAREEAEAFAGLLLESARGGADIYIVITMRSEYLGACALVPGLAEAINAGLYLTRRMVREECRQAILGPAGVIGFDIEPRLVNRLLNDLSSFAPWEADGTGSQLERLSRRADQLPLMQHVLSRLWRRARERTGERPVLTHADYESVGGLQGALDAHAEEIEAALPEAARSVIRPLFRALVTGTSLADAVRRPRTLAELEAVVGGDPAAVRAAIEAFRAPDANFLRPSAPAPLNASTIVDISHESLIRQWTKLAGWLEEEARAITSWQRLVNAQARHERGEGDLLRGRDLDNIAAWWDREQPNEAWAHGRGGDYRAVAGFLAASRAQTEAEEAARRAEERRKRRAWRVSAIAAAIALALMTGLSVLLGVQWHRANQQQAALLDSNRQLEASTARLEAANRMADTERVRAEDSLSRAKDVLNSVVDLLGSDANFARIGAEDLESGLLNRVRPHFQALAGASQDPASVTLAELQSRFLLGRLSFRVQPAEQALPILADLYADLDRLGSVRSRSEEETALLVKTGALLSSLNKKLGNEKANEPIWAQLSALVPKDTDDITTLSITQLDAYSWYLSYHRDEVPWSRESQWRVPISRREVAVTDLMVERQPGRPDFEYSLSLALNSLYSSLNQAGDATEAEGALLRSLAAAKAAQEAAPGNGTFVTALTWAHMDHAEMLRQQGKLAEARTAAETAWSILEPRLAIAGQTAFMLNLGSATLERLGSVLQDSGDVAGAMDRQLQAMGLILRQIEADPANRSIADDAVSRFGSLSYALGARSDDERTRQQCLDLAVLAQRLAERQPRVPQYLQLTASTLRCALDAERSLAKAAKPEAAFIRPVADFIAAHAEFLRTAFQAPLVTHEIDSEYHANMALIIQELAAIAGRNGLPDRQASEDELIISVVTPMRPAFDYDLYLMQKLPKAQEDLGDIAVTRSDPEAAATHWRLCADPAQVPYASRACMEKLAKLIEDGRLGPGHEKEAEALQALMPHYAMKRFTIKVPYLNGGQTVPFDVYVPPATGYEGIDDQVKWLHEARGLNVPPQVAESFRKLHRLARENNLSFPELAAYALGEVDETKLLDDLIKELETKLAAKDEAGLTALVDKAGQKPADAERLGKALAQLAGGELKPEDVQTIAALTNRLAYSTSARSAIPAFNALLARSELPAPDLAALYLARGRAYERIGDTPRAEDDLLLVLSLYPDNASALNLLGYGWVEGERHLPLAVELLKRATTAKPDDPYIRDSLGWALVKVGQLQQGAEQLESAATAAPEAAEIMAHLGEAYRQLGRKVEAGQMFERALGQANDEKLEAFILSHQALLEPAQEAGTAAPDPALAAARLLQGADASQRSEISTDEVGVAIRGYDPVSYFTDNTPLRGRIDHAELWHSALWLFASEANRKLFAADPAHYAPVFGGHCAYCAAIGHKIHGDPQIWQIHDDHLYFHQSKGLLDAWAEAPDRYIKDAETRWPDVKQMGISPDKASPYSKQIEAQLQQAKSSP